MINLFTYLSFTNISIGQLYQHFIVALLAIIIMYSTYFSLRKIPSSINVKEGYQIFLSGFLIIILNVGLFFLFLYFATSGFYVSADWLPMFSFIIHIVNLAGYTVLATALLVPKFSSKLIRNLNVFVITLYLLFIFGAIGFFIIPAFSGFVSQYLLGEQYFILAGNCLYIFFVLSFLLLSRFKANGFINASNSLIALASILHSLTIINPRLIRYVFLYNLLMILAFMLVEIFIFYGMIRELSKVKNQIEGLNSELEEKINERTQELYNSNKELFHSNYMLHQEKEKLNAIIDNMEEGIIVSNISHQILMINAQAKNMLGLNRNVIGSIIGEVIPNRQYTQEIYQIILKKVRKISREIQIITKDRGTIFLHITSTLSSDSKGNVIGVITLIRDISKEVEIDQLKTGILKTISHELKTPLTTIIGFVETLDSQRRGRLNENQREYVGIVLKESLHLSKLIDDLLEFSKITSNKITLSLEEISLKQIVSDILDSFRPQLLLKGVELEFDDSVNIPTIQADREKVHKVFLNIIKNAVYYTDKGVIRISFETAANKLITKVSDSGVGISEKDLDRIFERFIQVEKNNTMKYQSGLGLGLSIARDFVALHDGNIWAESKVGEGSVFFIELPITH